MYLDCVCEANHIFLLNYLNATCRPRVRTLLYQFVLRVRQQCTSEEHHQKEILHFLEDNDVLSVVAIARLPHLKSSIKPRLSKMGRNSGNFFRPKIGSIDVVIYRGILHCFALRTTLARKKFVLENRTIGRFRVLSGVSLDSFPIQSMNDLSPNLDTQDGVNRQTRTILDR